MARWPTCVASQANEQVRSLDINALLESMADDARVLGRSIQIQGQAQQAFQGRLTALRRALQNLIDNAFKYGQGASIRVEDSPAMLKVTVEDSGPWSGSCGAQQGHRALLPC